MDAETVKHTEEFARFRVIISKGNIDFIRDGKTLFNAVVEESNVAKLDGLIQIQTALASTVDRTLLHRRCAHVSKERLEKLVKNKLTVNLKLDSEAPLADLCETCIMGKQHRFPFPETSDYSDLKPLDLVVSDVHGPLPVCTAQGYRYWILFLDVASRLYVVYYMREKSQAFACFKEFKAWAENHFERKMKVFRDDKGGEYMSNDMDQYLKEHGIRREHTVRATPQQNGMAERANRTMAEGVTCMLVEARLPPSFWGEALSTFVYVRNRLPTASLPNHTTPYELAYKKKPTIVHFRVFGCRAYVLVQKDQRRSLEPHSVPCIFLGYPEGYKGWRCYDPATRKIIISRDVVFNEHEFPGLSTKSITSAGQPVSFTLDEMHKVLLPVEDPDDDIAEGALPAPQPVPEPAPAQDNLHDNPVEPVVAPNPQPEPVPMPAPVVTPAPAPVPEKSRSRSRKKGDMGPPPAPSRKSSRSSNPPGEWWKVSNSSQYRDPDPPIPETDDERELAQETAEEDDRHAALLTQGLNF
ncbi:hypothetical protein EUX98_g9630, partial [Antrodiella citrinella]